MSSPLAVEEEPEAAGFDAGRLARVDALLDRYVEDRRLPGWSLLVARRGRVVHLGRGGLRDVEAGRPVEFDTVFRIYSMTKPVTSAAAMMLWERGAFQLTDPVSRYLPEFADMRVYTGGSELSPTTEPAAEPIRIWHLFTHTSGLTYDFHRVHPVDAMYRTAFGEWNAGGVNGDLAQRIGTLATLPLVFQPGSEWNYSMSTDVLGRLIEVLTGSTLDVAFRDLVLDPLDMSDTAFAVADTNRDRLAALYTPGLARNDALGAGFEEPDWLSGGGGLSSTLRDYHRFTTFLLRRGELDGVRLLGDRTVRYMMRNHLPGNADLITFGRPLFAESPMYGTGFGLGFAVLLDPVATHTHGSPGEVSWGGAASTAFWVDPVEQVTVVFMTQLLPSSRYPIRSQLRQLVYSALVGP